MTIEARIAEFLKDRNCLIVEPSTTFSSSIQSCLQTIGVRGDQIFVARKFQDAKRMIAELRPKLLVTEYDMVGGWGLALVEEQEKHYKESERISIIATKNLSDSAIAESAEEQVDAYVLKPFSAEFFRDRLKAVFEQKLNPSTYGLKIREGKANFEAKDFVRAVEDFVTAKTMDAKPTLACFYAGQSLFELGDKARALAEFQEGRRFQPLHYKCLTGEFESLMDAKRYPEAYELSVIMRGHFPVTSSRLGQFFIAAVFTHHFEDLPKYYEMYQALDHRTPWLIRLTSLAFLTAGKFALAKGDLPKAVEYFDLGSTVTGRDVSYLNMIVDELVKIRATDFANQFLSKVPSNALGGAAHAQLEFKVHALMLPKDELIEKGRKLALAGFATPELYEQIVVLMAEANKLALAETVIGKAVATHPSMRDALYKLLETHAKR